MSEPDLGRAFVGGRDRGHEGAAQVGLAHSIDNSFSRSRFKSEIVAN